MAFTRPDLQSIVDRVKGDFKSTLGLSVILRRSTEDAFSKAIAAVSHSLHGHMRFISRQIFVDQAEQEYLERWASIYKIQRKAATFAELIVSGTGTDTTVIAAGTSIQRSDGQIYLTTAEVTIAAGIFSVNVLSETAGADSNIDDGETVSLLSPISGVDSDLTVTATATEGEDVETDESLRDRLLSRIRQPPSGGTANDYIQFIRDNVAGATRAWVLPGGLGEGTVTISFVEDGEDPIIPSGAKVAEAQAVIDLKAPANAEGIVFAPNANTVNVSVAITPNTESVRTAVTAELEDLFSREGQVGGSFRAVGSTYDGGLALSKIREAISIATGEEDHSLVSPTSDVVTPVGSIIILGTVTFSTLV